MKWIRLKQKILLSLVLKIPYSKIRVWALREAGFKVGKEVYVGDGISLAVGFGDPDMKLILQDRVSIGPNVTIVLVSHSNYSPLTTVFYLHKYKKILINEGAWIGAGAIILPGVSLGRYCVVGAGSVVTRNVADYTIVAGNPTRVLRVLDENKLNDSKY